MASRRQRYAARPGHAGSRHRQPAAPGPFRGAVAAAVRPPCRRVKLFLLSWSLPPAAGGRPSLPRRRCAARRSGASLPPPGAAAPWGPPFPGCGGPCVGRGRLAWVRVAPLPVVRGSGRGPPSGAGRGVGRRPGNRAGAVVLLWSLPPAGTAAQGAAGPRSSARGGGAAARRQGTRCPPGQGLRCPGCSRCAFSKAAARQGCRARPAMPAGSQQPKFGG